MNQNDQMRALIDAAEEDSKGYEDDPRPDVRCDVMNAFFRGAHWQKKQALSHVNKTPKNEHESDDVLTKAQDVDHIGDANKMVRLTDEKLTEIYMRFVGHEGLSPRIFEDVAGCVMAAMISNNAPPCVAVNDDLLKALKDTDRIIAGQLELIQQRATSDFLDKRPVVQSLTAHRTRIQKAIEAAAKGGV